MTQPIKAFVEMPISRRAMHCAGTGFPKKAAPVRSAGVLSERLQTVCEVALTLVG